MTHSFRLIGLSCILSLSACGAHKPSLFRSDLRNDDTNKSMDVRTHERIQPVAVSVNDDGSVALNNRLQANWNGWGFVGSTNYDIVPID